MNLNKQEILSHWYAEIYDQNVIETKDIECLLSILGAEPKRVLEVACGTGRICVPLAKAGHIVSGFDMDEAMLLRAQCKAEFLPNLHCYHMNALVSDWGDGFEVVVMAGNLFINIVTAGDYQQAQRTFLKKAYDTLMIGGHLYLDFDCVDWPDVSADDHSEWVCFEGTDDRGTYGKFIVVSGGYSSKERKSINSIRRYEIIPERGDKFSIERVWNKYFPTLEQTCSWLYDAGFSIDRLYGSYDKQPFTPENRRAVIWAKKV